MARPKKVTEPIISQEEAKKLVMLIKNGSVHSGIIVMKSIAKIYKIKS